MEGITAVDGTDTLLIGNPNTGSPDISFKVGGVQKMSIYSGYIDVDSYLQTRNIRPVSNDGWDLGTSTKVWNKVYLNDIYHDSTQIMAAGANIADFKVNLEAPEIDITTGFLNLKAMTGATADGLTSQDGSMYYRTDTNTIRVKLNGSWVTVSTA